RTPDEVRFMTIQLWDSSGGTVLFILGPVNTNPMHPVVPEKAPIKAHPKGTSFGAQPEGLGLFSPPAALSFAHVE
ncbi:MAG: hypothetical protein KME58_03630, partial [Candidatus Thiodiazotropha sp. (ex Lucina pensylvanica)]|nr:hypothetical protein [Candidatus Thiodiazotropha sp. (ex Lucina pensylvanica)]